MANINGTQFNDFIHRTGDGFGPFPGFTEFTGVTAAADVINANAGNDFVFADDGNDTVTGGTGDDFLFGDNGNDRLIGGDGTDTLFGGAGLDSMSGGAGNDLFTIGQISDIDGLAETIDGGADIDRLDFDAEDAIGPADISAATLIGVELLTITGNDITLTAAQLGGFTGISAGGALDRLFLSAAGTVDLTGAAIIGIDEFRGTAGNDRFIMTGVALGQTVNTLAGSDTITGSDGSDLLGSGAGVDTIAGGLGNDTAAGGSEADSVSGDSGSDLLTGGGGIDKLFGEDGNDTFRIQFVGDISGLAETVDGGIDSDRLDFQQFNATGAVNLSAAELTDIEELFLNGNGASMLGAQMGAFLTISGTGLIERLILSAQGTADLTGATVFGIDEIRGSAGNDRILLIDVAQAQTVDGRAGNDTVRGGDAADVLFGGLGADSIFGNDGNDTVRAGQGADGLDGGVGYDIFQIQQVSDISGLAEDIAGGADVDTLDFQTLNAFGAVNLTAMTITGVETLALSGNTVTLTAAQLSAFETIAGTGLIETVILSAAGSADLTNAGVTGIDEFRGSAGADSFTFANAAQGQTVNGLAGADTLNGATGGDALSGGDGNDTVSGAGGGDVLIGGLGVDRLTGGLGFDVFDFNDRLESGPSTAADTIVDFTHGDDAINLSDIDANTEVQGNQAFAFIGAAAFGNVAGQLRYALGSLLGDVNGDSATDFRVILTGSPAIVLNDLLL